MSRNETNEKLSVYLRKRMVYIHSTRVCKFSSPEVQTARVDLNHFYVTLLFPLNHGCKVKVIKFRWVIYVYFDMLATSINSRFQKKLDEV